MYEKKTTPAIIADTGESLTYQKLKEEIRHMAAGMRKGVVAVIWMDQEMAAVLYYLACLYGGVIPLLLHIQMPSRTVKEYVTAYQAEYLVVPQKYGDLDWFSKEDVRCREIGENRTYCILERRGSGVHKIMPHPELGILLTTSGTSGIAKTVRISRRNLFSNAENICKYLGIHEKDRGVTSLPLSYTYGLSVLNTHLYRRATVLLTKRSVLQKEFWDFVQEERGTSLAGVPYTYELLKRRGFLNQDYPSLRVLTQSGGKLSLKLQKQFGEYADAHHIRMFLMYGQTEATARISYLPPEQIRNKQGSVGIPIPGGKLYVRQRPELEAGEGEIIYSGKNVSFGYAECREDLQRGDENKGVLNTGDIGYLDSDGYLYLTGRISRFAKICGKRINLQGLQDQIQQHWNINVSCREENERLFVTFEEKGKEMAEEVRRWLLSELRLGREQIGVENVRELPKSYAGKYR